MKHCLLLLLCLLTLATGMAYGRFSPDFSFTDLDGQTYSSSDLRNTPLVIYVGSTL